MFKQVYGNVTIEAKAMPKRGACLCISKEDGEYICADYCGMNPMLVPDGTNAYFFGNKLILVTRWSDISEAEKKLFEDSELIVAIHPYTCLQFSINIGGNWGDVMTTLPNCSKKYNNTELPIDEIIFIFADTHDSDYVTSRAVKLPYELQRFLQEANRKSLSYFCVDDAMSEIRSQAESDRMKDEFDYIYDICYEKTKGFSRKAKAYDPANVPDGIYVSINSANEITDVQQRESEDNEQISEEVKIYLSLAEKGIDDAAYNLGVCYENGDGVKQDFSKAVYWYKKAADKGNAAAQHNLGICFYNGSGVAVDHSEAARLFKLSAEQGNMYAQYNLAVMYMKGEGVAENVNRAVLLLKMAATAGHPQAKAFVEQYNL